MDVLMRGALALVLLAVAACATDLGEPHPWIDWQDVQGPLRPEVTEPASPAVPKAQLRVVTFNVHFGADVPALAAALTTHPQLGTADVIFVQEIESHPAEGSSRTTRLAAALGMGSVYAPARLEGDGTHGIAILSRLPLENVQVMELPHAELAIAERHRIAVGADVRVGGETLRVVNVHLDTRLNLPDRILQLRSAIADAPHRVVVGGDLNTSDYAWADATVPMLSLGSTVDSGQAPALDEWVRHLGFETPTAGFGPTQRSLIGEMRLDSIYTRSFSTGAGAVARDVDLSDHWPLWLDVAL